MNIRLTHWFGKRGRRHPIKRDQSGRSARRRAFDLFDRGMRLSPVAPQVGISHGTAYRYFQQWKKQPRYLELKYRLLRAALRGRRARPEQFAEALAAALHIPPERAIQELEKPCRSTRPLCQRDRPFL